METERTSYLPPQCETLELLTEGMIAGSTDPDNYINPFGEQQLI